MAGAPPNVVETIRCTIEALGLGPVLTSFAHTRMARPGLYAPCALVSAVGEAVGAPPETSERVAAAAGLVWLGADLLDDLADGDAPSEPTPALQTLVACALLQAAPAAVLTGLAPEVGAGRCVDALAALGRALAQMARGQADDLTLLTRVDVAARDADDAVAVYDAVVARKAGAEFACFAYWAAWLGGADAESAAAWEAFGRSVGCLAQVRSDLVGALRAPHVDLRAGKMSQLVLVARHLLEQPERAALDRALDEAADGDPDAPARAAGWLDTPEARLGVDLKVELHRYRAAAALAGRARPPAIERLLMRNLVAPESL